MKRARYDGPFDEVRVFDPETDVYAAPVDTVKKGGLLSADVPARIRDELLKTDEWSEVNQTTASASDKKES